MYSQPESGFSIPLLESGFSIQKPEIDFLTVFQLQNPNQVFNSWTRIRFSNSKTWIVFFSCKIQIGFFDFKVGSRKVDVLYIFILYSLIYFRFFTFRCYICTYLYSIKIVFKGVIVIIDLRFRQISSNLYILMILVILFIL